MKKKYLSPEVVELVEVTEDLMDVTSPSGFDGNLDNNNNDVIDDPNDILSRKVWDDGVE